jgi:hypothetical protein
MSVTVKNMVILAWRLEDGDYQYQGQFEYTQEEYANLDWDAVLERQTAEYNTWREMFDNMKAQQ